MLAGPGGVSIVLGPFGGGSKRGCGNWRADGKTAQRLPNPERGNSFLSKGSFAVEAGGGTEFFFDA
jgi:hypothetical protein